MRRGSEGKIGLGAILVCAAAGYGAWQWGVPWVERMARKPEAPPPSADADGVPDAPPPPKPTPAPTTTKAPEPDPPAPDPAANPAPTTSPSNPTPVDPREAAALKLFNEARNWEANQRWETAMAKYEELIEVYKGTQAAEEAVPRLKALQSK